MSDKWMDVADVSLDDIIQMQKNKKGGTGKKVRCFFPNSLKFQFPFNRILGMVYIVGPETA